MIFFFYGPNTYAARHKMRDMMDAYIKKSGSDFGLERIDGAAATTEVLSAALQATPFLANSRLVITEGLGSNKTLGENLPHLLEQIPETTVAVFYEPEVDQRTVYFKTLMKLAKAVKFDKLAPLQLSAWIKREVESQSGQIDQTSVNLLLEIVGDDQWRLEQEIQKLVNYNLMITRDAINLLVARSDVQSIFELVDAMSAGRVSAAISIYRGLLADQTNEFYILTMVTWQLRNLLLAKTAGPVSANDLAKRAGMSPYVAGKALDKQHQVSEEVLKEAFLAAVETDFAIKSGQGQADQLVEKLIYDVASGMNLESGIKN